MRILHVIQEMRTGGAERVVASLVRGATERGHVVAVAAAPGAVADELGLQPFPLPLLERRPWRIPGGAWRVFRAIRAFRPDVVHAQNPAMAVLVALATGRGRRPASLVSVHGVPEADYGPAAKLLRAAGLPVVACGPGVETGLADAGFRSAETIANAVPPPPAPRDRAELERELGLPAGAQARRRRRQARSGQEPRARDPGDRGRARRGAGDSRRRAAAGRARAAGDGARNRRPRRARRPAQRRARDHGRRGRGRRLRRSGKACRSSRSRRSPRARRSSPRPSAASGSC